MKNIDDFLSHISKEDCPNDDWSELIQAMWWAKKGLGDGTQYCSGC